MSKRFKEFLMRCIEADSIPMGVGMTVIYIVLCLSIILLVV